MVYGSRYIQKHQTTNNQRIKDEKDQLNNGFVIHHSIFQKGCTVIQATRLYSSTQVECLHKTPSMCMLHILNWQIKTANFPDCHQKINLSFSFWNIWNIVALPLPTWKRLLAKRLTTRPHQAPQRISTTIKHDHSCRFTIHLIDMKNKERNKENIAFLQRCNSIVLVWIME